MYLQNYNKARMPGKVVDWRMLESIKAGDCTRSGTASPGTEPVTWLVRLDATSMGTNGNCAGDQVEDARMYRLLDSAFALPGLPSWKENAHI